GLSREFRSKVSAIIGRPVWAKSPSALWWITAIGDEFPHFFDAIYARQDHSVRSNVQHALGPGQRAGRHADQRWNVSGACCNQVRLKRLQTHCRVFEIKPKKIDAAGQRFGHGRIGKGHDWTQGYG